MINSDNLPNKSGIYKIENLITHKSYIGQSKNIYNRYHNHHKYDYENPKNSQYDTKLYKAIRKYGIHNFLITVIELCEEADLDNREIYWINYYNTYKDGYNSTPGGQFQSPNLFSSETEEKRRITREKNKSLQNENHPRAKLTNQEVIEIRQRYINGESIQTIYTDYSDRYTNIDTFRNIIFGNSYSSVLNIPKENIRYTNAKLMPDQIREIRQKYKTGNYTYASLGKEYGIAASGIGLIIKGKTYAHVI